MKQAHATLKDITAHIGAVNKGKDDNAVPGSSDAANDGLPINFLKPRPNAQPINSPKNPTVAPRIVQNAISKMFVIA